MLKINKNKVKILPAIFAFLLLVHFYLYTFFEYNVFFTFGMGKLFEKVSMLLNFMLIFSLLLATLIEFAKFIHLVEINMNNKKSVKWIIKKENLTILVKLIVLTLPFIIFYLVKFFTKETYDLGYSKAFLAFSSFSIVLIIVLIVLFFTYRSLISVNLIEKENLILQELTNKIYEDTIFLDVLNFSEDVYLSEVNNEIKLFLTTEKVKNDINFIKKRSIYLSSTKKATTPPHLHLV